MKERYKFRVIKNFKFDLLSNDGSQCRRNISEEHSASIDVLAKLTKESTEEEHHVVEGVETVPESAADESSEVVVEARFLTRHKCSHIHVVL